MKIRIQGSSIRFRLSQTDVRQLTDEGAVTEFTDFGGSVFSYEVKQSFEADQLTASFENGKITMQIPASYVEDWAINDIVGFEAHVHTAATDTMYLLIEKDFKCLDRTTEDQSDQYENPNKTC